MASGERVNLGFISLIVAVATIGGFMFGYDSGAINGTQEGLRQTFGLDEAALGLTVSALLPGCALGAFLAGRFADIMGRRTVMMLAAALFVVWMFHYIAPEFRFPLLALVAVLLLLQRTARGSGALLLGGSIGAAGALLAFWMNWLGAHGFRLRDLLGFLLLLGFGRIVRRKQLLPDELQSIGIVVGLAALTQWVWLWVNFSAPTLPITVVWAVVAAIVISVGWRLHEQLYRLFGWALLLVALGRVVWVDFIESRLPMGADPAFRLGLLAVGLSALVAALTYARLSAASASSA